MNMIQIFYRGTTNSIFTRWRTPGVGWSDEQHIGGDLSGDPIAAQVPGTEILQLFYRGTDNSIYTRWINPDWSQSGEEYIGGVLKGDPIAAQIPGTDILQLFYRKADNSIYTRWRKPDGSWSDEEHIGGTLNGDPVAAQIPGTDILQLFYRGNDNSIYSRWRTPNVGWSDEQKIGGELKGDPVAAQIPGTDILQLFYRGTDNSIYSRWRTPNVGWSDEQKIGGDLNGNPIVAYVVDISPLAPVDLSPQNGASGISDNPFLFFRDPGVGTPAAAESFQFMLTQNVLLNSPPNTGPGGTNSPLAPPGVKWDFPLPAGDVTLTVWGTNKAGNGPSSSSIFTVGSAPPAGGSPPPPVNPAISVRSSSSGPGSVFVVTGTRFSPNKDVRIRVVDDALNEVDFHQSADAGGNLNATIPLSCISGGGLHFSATDGRPSSDPTGVLWSNTFNISCP